MTELADIRTLRIFGVIRRKGHVLSEEALTEEWYAVDRQKQRGEAPIAAFARSYFRDQADDILDLLPDALEPFLGQQLSEDALSRRLVGRSAAYRIKNELIVQRIFDEAKWAREFDLRFPPAVVQVVQQGFNNGLARVNASGIDFTSDTPGVQRTLGSIVEKTKNINQTTTRELTDLIQRSLVEGVDMDTITSRVAGQFQQYQGPRAQLIARTAGAGAFEGGQQQAFEDADVEMKRWLSQRDGDVRQGRFDHAEPDGQEVQVDGDFIVSGEHLRFPADPNGSVGNLANCRCTSQPLIRD